MAAWRLNIVGFRNRPDGFSSRRSQGGQMAELAFRKGRWDMRRLLVTGGLALLVSILNAGVAAARSDGTATETCTNGTTTVVATVDAHSVLIGNFEHGS